MIVDAKKGFPEITILTQVWWARKIQQHCYTELKTRHCSANTIVNQRVKKDRGTKFDAWMGQGDGTWGQTERPSSRVGTNENKTTSNKLTKRLKARRNLKAEVAQLKDLRAECSNDTDQLEQNQPRAQEDKKTCVFGRQGGISSQLWPLHIMYYARVWIM